MHDLGAPQRFDQGLGTRSLLAFPVPYLALLLFVPMVSEGPPGWWSTMPVGSRVCATFVLVELALLGFLVASALWYRLADPHGLGRKSLGRSELFEQLSFGGIAAMVVAWAVHARELSSGSVWILVSLMLTWCLMTSRMARRAHNSSDA